MKQSRLGSLIEALANTCVGFSVNFIANLVILPKFGFTSLTLENNFYIGLLYTVISVVRSYAVRRWFNARLHSAAELLARRLLNLK